MNSEAAQQLADAVRERRLELGLKQQQAATRARVSLPTWRAVEQGHRDALRPLTARGICQALQWTPDSVDRIIAGGAPVIVTDVDPVRDEIQRLRDQITETEERLAVIEARYRQTGTVTPSEEDCQP